MGLIPVPAPASFHLQGHFQLHDILHISPDHGFQQVNLFRGRLEDQLIMYLRYHLQPYQFTITSLPEYCLHRRIVERRTPRGDSSNETFNDTLSLWNSRNIFTIQKPAFQLKVGIQLQAESLICKLIPSLHERPVYPCHLHPMDSIIRPNL